MFIGAHVSAAGGVWNAPKNAAAIGCEVLQMFTRPPMGGAAPKLTQDDAAHFRRAMKEHGIERAYIHSPYFVNLASGKKAVRKNSARIIREELERGSLLGCRAVMFHPGSAKDVGATLGLQYVIETIDVIMDGYEGSCQLLIEISAG
ncbi:TIM barrel protein, partial [Candidatus Uhrbacteria bacterium]|nr:TIM barrel protein [Candidatus Uhrbacteria bacterium]